tara:strand:- start:16 stop:342 length:327 start_codon:yes stop_codon:yes gene_type:complete
MALTDWTNLHVQTAAGSITGSIHRVCAGTTDVVTITSYTTGTFKGLAYANGDTADITGSQNGGATTYTDDLTLDFSKTACIDGPFIAIHGDGDTVLVYNSGLANVVTD